MIKRLLIIAVFVFSHFVHSNALNIDSLSFCENSRIGISWFEQANYLKAIKYLEQAHYYFQGDSILNSYLYFSYKYMNRCFEKNSLYSELAQSSKEQFFIQSPKPIFSSCYEVGYIRNKDDDFYNWNSRNLNEKGVNINVSLSQNLKNRWLINHKLIANFQSGDIELRTSSGSVETYSERYKLFCYSPSLSFWKNRALSFSLYGHFMCENYQGVEGGEIVYNRYHPEYHDHGRYRERGESPYWERPWGEKNEHFWEIPPDFQEDSNFQEDFKVSISEESSFDFLIGSSVSYSFLQFQVDGEFSYLNYADGNSFQFGVNGIYYPLGNLNLYFKLKFYYLWRNVQLQAETASHNPLAEALIGYKVLPVWWMELSYLHGNMRYYNEVDTHSIYLFGCDPKFRVSWLNILPIKDNFSINLSYRLFSMKKDYYSLQNYNWIVLQNKTIGHSLTVGLLWKY